MTQKKRERIKAEVPRPEGERAMPRVKAGSPEAREALTPPPEAPLDETPKSKSKK